MKTGQELVKNTGILAIGMLSSKVFSIILLPLYTYSLEKADYGTVDVLQSIITIVIPIFTFEICSGLFRYIISRNEENYKTQVVTTTMIFLSCGCALFLAIMLSIRIFWSFDYYFLFIIGFLSTVFATYMQQYARGIGDNLTYSITSFVGTLVSLLINILLITQLHFGAESILIAYFLSNIVVGMIILFRVKIWKYFERKAFDKNLLKDMLKYTLPLVPNTISWWVSNTSDRLIILGFLGAGSNGIYAVANKIPQMYLTVFNVYNLAWVESISRNIESDNIANYIQGIMRKSVRAFACFSLLIITGMSLVFDWLIGSEYADAYYHTYILLIAVFVSSLCSMYGSILTGYRDSKSIGTTTVIGAIANLAVNFTLVHFIGLYAASLSTLISYIVILVVRIIRTNGHVRITYSGKTILLLLLVTAVVTGGYFLNNKPVNIGIFCVLLIFTYATNKSMLKELMNMVKSKVSKA